MELKKLVVSFSAGGIVGIILTAKLMRKSSEKQVSIIHSKKHDPQAEFPIKEDSSRLSQHS